MNARQHPDNSPAAPATPAPRGLSRRTAVRTAAWTVPAVTVAAAAPAFATSEELDASWIQLTTATAEWGLSGGLWLQVGRKSLFEGGQELRITTSRDSRSIPADALKVNVAFPSRFVRNDVNTDDRDMAVRDVSPGWVADPPRYFLNGTDSRYATVTFTYTQVLEPDGGLFRGGTLPLRFDARRDTTLQHATYYTVDALAFSYTAPGFPPGTGVITIV